MKHLFILLSLVFTIQPTKAQSGPAFWPEITNFKKQDASKMPEQHAILFVGSSSFTKWTDVSDYFPGYTIINHGFGGSTLVDVIRYAYDVILPYHPKQVVIYCGENDLAYSDTVSPIEVLKRVQTLFAMIRINLPSATIDFVSIKPSPVRASIQQRVIEANRLIKAYIQTQKNAAFIDVYHAMLDSKGNMREEIYLSDRLHMKPEGYAIWKRIIQPYLLKK
jgi:Lysophospholipase L1 and related esterases